MFQENESELKRMGASITTREIKQQPILWKGTLDNFKAQEPKIRDFLHGIEQKRMKENCLITLFGLKN